MSTLGRILALYCYFSDPRRFGWSTKLIERTQEAHGSELIAVEVQATLDPSTYSGPFSLEVILLSKGRTYVKSTAVPTTVKK